MKTFIQGVVAAAVIGSATAMLYGCGDKATPPTSEAAAASAQPTEPQAEIAKNEPPPAPEHAYALAEDGEYGYQRALSEDDKKAGRATAALLMVRYLGEKQEIRSIKIVDGNLANIISCAPPCKFVKSRSYYSGRLVKTETVPVTDGSLIQAVMADAISGQLHVYGKQAN
ncbi:hypothetical protein LJR029_005491 [Caballeronia sp. LjRoot29]|uniref:hypothetical protein n=1 Tax=Caballeronia sp. LjRoot29 TaxID=3342315 RepID=UPI003ED0C7CE